MRKVFRDERGMALAVAIFALVIVGALVAGAFFAGTQEQRVGENQRRVMTSFGIAEAGAQERMLQWDPGTMNRVKQYPESTIAIANVTAPGGTGSYGGAWYRMGPNIFLFDITGQDERSAAGTIAGGGGARQRVGMIARIAPVEFGIRASLTTQGTVNVGGNAVINGNDQNPAGWASCSPPGPAQAGVRDAGGTVTSTGTSTVTGTPPVVNDPSITDATFTTFGGATYASLAARANVVLPGGATYRTEPIVVNGVCNKNVLTNWGDGTNPAAPCGNYFPIIHIRGNAQLNGVQGQGILLVDGTLTVQGSYEFYGITIIQGDLITAGGGSTDAHFWGGVMSKNADLSAQSISGRANLNFSSCAILAALQAQSPISPMRQRGWAQLF
jgi:hypothetical protein